MYNLFPNLHAVVNCGGLSPLGLLMVDQSNTTFNSTATFSCPIGYNLVGSAVRTCGADGRYTGVQPSCICESILSQLASHF